jgi:hypothetical protein
LRIACFKHLRHNSVQPRDPVSVAGLIQELSQLRHGQAWRGRMTRGYLAQKIKVISDEDPEVPGICRLVDADEVRVLQGSRK